MSSRLAKMPMQSQVAVKPPEPGQTEIPASLYPPDAALSSARLTDGLFPHLAEAILCCNWSAARLRALTQAMI
jgi:hypothetical protein